ncbi:MULTISPECIES: hypothetical protein [Cupriavidus]|nr:hypothetical protein [Cupriavidus pauculus]MCM3609348.1 hypothetical protein [Cupriavidus pauculus]
MTERVPQDDRLFAVMQTMLGNAFRLSATLGDARRDVFKAHLRAME